MNRRFIDKLIITFVCLILLYFIVKDIKTTFENFDNPMYTIPKIVWTHWATNDMPELCKLTLERMKKVLSDWDVRFFTNDDFLEWCEPPEEYHKLAIQAQTDFMRLWLLKEHGGVWMDISIVLNQSINPIYDECVSQKSELGGFFAEHLTSNPEYPVFDSWFIMAPKGSNIIRLWYDEFLDATKSGFKNYKDRMLKDGVDPEKIFPTENETYLTIHLCFLTVIQKRVSTKPNIYYLKSGDTMFKIHSKCNWDSECMKKEFNSPSMKDIPYIKLRGNDRDLFPLEMLK